jgi:transposase
MMKKTFRVYEPDQLMLMPPAINDWLPDGHVVHFVSEVVEQGLDLSPIFQDYTDPRGQPPYHPVMMVKVWMYGYMRGIRSSRKLERALYEDVGFRVLAGNQQPDFWTLAAFRRRHLEALGQLFAQTVELAEGAGLLPLQAVASDGTRIRANASKHKALSYGRMDGRMDDLRREIEEYLEQVERNDQAEDEQYGVERRGDELPEHLQTKAGRIEAIRRAKAELEARARAKAEAEQEQRAAAAEAEGRTYRPRKKQHAPEPRPKDQFNFTDPDSRIMRAADKSFIQGYNGQVTVDVDTQIIVAADLTNEGVDAPQLAGQVAQTQQHVARWPQRWLADAGYFSAVNLELLTRLGIEVFIPPDRIRHNEWYRPRPSSTGFPEDPSPAEQLRQKLGTPEGRETYQQRQTSVEPVFGQLKEALGFRQLLLRGLARARSEWRLVCAAHNLWKLHRAGADLQGARV